MEQLSSMFSAHDPASNRIQLVSTKVVVRLRSSVGAMILVTGSLLWDSVLVLVGLCLTVYFYYQHKFRYWTERGVQGPKPIPIFGNFLQPLLQKRSPGQFVWDVYNSVPDKPVAGFYIFGRPALLLRDPNLIKHALVKDFNIFGDRHVSAYEKDHLGTQNLFVLKGAPWKYLRVKLSPTFTSGRMKKMFPLVSSCARNLTEYLQEVAPMGPVELKETTAKFTTDVISICAFGIQSNSLKDPKAEFREFGRKIFHFTRYRTLEVMGLFFMPSLVQLLKASFFTPSTTRFLRQVFWDTIQFREKNHVIREDFLDLLIQLKNKGSVTELSGESPNESEDIRAIGKLDDKTLFEFDGDNLLAQPAIFFTAGFETNATTISFTLYELALQPDLQSRLRSEIASVVEKTAGKPTYEDIFSMKYLGMVVSETLRKYPPLPLLDRVCLQDYKLPDMDVTLEKGTPIFVALLGLHRDPKYFPDPERYDPERFSEEVKRTREPYTYMPFGEGPHNCIGMRFGLMAVKTGLFHLLSQFEVQPCKDTPIPLVLSTRSSVLASSSGLPLKLIRSEATVTQ